MKQLLKKLLEDAFNDIAFESEDDFTSLLYKVVKDELSASIQYTLQSKNQKDHFFKAELIEHAKEEFNHYTMLVEHFDLPFELDIDYNFIQNIPNDFIEAIDLNISKENEAIEDYEKLISLSTKKEDIDLFTEIKNDEIEHIKDMEEVKKKGGI